MPGLIYIALGDPLQKRNYYRTGWLRFREDADMTAVMAELSEKKVSSSFLRLRTSRSNVLLVQIEGFKLHVAHNIRPFVNKIRCAPEVASRPDKLAKDLQNVKLLATILEDQAAELRAFKPPPASASVPAGSGDQNGTAGPGEEGVVNSNGKAEEQDAEMTAPDEGGGATVEEEEEPKERGSDAVERRIEKFISDMRDQGLVDVNDEKVFKEKKVGSGAFFFFASK